MAHTEACMFCMAPADPKVPALVPYCTRCWREEHPNVMARMMVDYRAGRSLTDGIAAQIERLMRHCPLCGGSNGAHDVEAHQAEMQAEAETHTARADEE